MKWLVVICGIVFLSFSLKAQEDDLEQLLEKEMAPQTDFATATFKSTRIITGHSIERMQQSDLDFRVAHRFGDINTGFNEFYGLDESSSHISLEYGITNWLMVGAGRATYQKIFNGFYKASILRQCKGKKNIPIFLSLYSNMMINSTEYEDPKKEKDFESRISYVHQLLIARKFSSRFSLQLTPTMLHRNLVKTKEDKNDLFALGLGGRFKLSNRIAVCAEYFYVNGLNQIDYITYYNPFSIGIDIETGSHVFQLHASNSFSMMENTFLAENTGNFWDGNIHIGFNITRVFTLKKKKLKPNE